jgi:hypothetical protein
MYEDITDLQNAKADKIDTYSEAQVDGLLSAKADKTDTYTKTDIDSTLQAKADKNETYDKNNIDTYLVEKANRFNVKLALHDFNLAEAPLYTITDADMLKIYPSSTIEYDFNDWCEYSYFDNLLDVNYLTLLQWEQQPDLDTCILTLHTVLKGDIPLYQYVRSTGTYTLLYGDLSIALDHPLGIRTAGTISPKLGNYIKGESASANLLNMDLVDLYQYVKAINYSSDDSINNIYDIIDEHTSELDQIYTKTETDVAHFTWNVNQSGSIKYNGSRWDYTITNNAQADNITIEVNAYNNYQIKDAGVTASKIADESITATKIEEEFLAQIENVQPDWNQNSSSAYDYIKNKPTIPTIPNVATTSTSGLMSYVDKVKLNTLQACVISTSPDFENIETTSRINSNNGTWQATATGYVRCYISAAAAVSASSTVTQHIIEFSVNDQIVDASGGHLVVTTAYNIGWYRTATIPVKKGDIVKMSLKRFLITQTI